MLADSTLTACTRQLQFLPQYDAKATGLFHSMCGHLRQRQRT